MSGLVSGKSAVDLAFIAYENGKKAGIAEVSPPARREAVWTTTAGEVRLSYPEPMPVWEVDFLEEFVTIWLRGLRRRAVLAEAVALSSAAPAPQSEAQPSTGNPATDEPNV